MPRPLHRHTHRRPPSVAITLRAATAVATAAFTTVAATGCSGGGTQQAVTAAGAWADTGVNAVSRPVIGSGVTAVTGLRADGTLETAVYDLVGGRRLWAQKATMAGRLPGMGVQPPAVIPAVGGTPGRGQVVAVEARAPRQGHKDTGTALVARDARTGTEVWSRPVDSTFGPARCGAYVCVSEATATRAPRFVAADPAAGGRPRWQTPGLAEVVWSDAEHVVLLRIGLRPSLESRDPATGRTRWTFPLERAVGRGVSLSGGWAFGVTDGTLVGSISPYKAGANRRPSAYGFLGLRVTDGRLLWARRQVLRVYPTPNPAVMPIGREVDQSGRYGAFLRLDPRTGRTVTEVPGERAPRTAWWLAFPDDLSALAFLTPDGRSDSYDLKKGAKVTRRGQRVWSFCTVAPVPLRITGLPGFYPTASLCAYDLGTGRRVAEAGPPPQWYTGAVDGRRVWRDERGALHSIKAPASSPAVPGMHG